MWHYDCLWILKSQCPRNHRGYGKSSHSALDHSRPTNKRQELQWNWIPQPLPLELTLTPFTDPTDPNRYGSIAPDTNLRKFAAAVPQASPPRLSFCLTKAVFTEQTDRQERDKGTWSKNFIYEGNSVGDIFRSRAVASQDFYLEGIPLPSPTTPTSFPSLLFPYHFLPSPPALPSPVSPPFPHEPARGSRGAL